MRRPLSTIVGALSLALVVSACASDSQSDPAISSQPEQTTTTAATTTTTESTDTTTGAGGDEASITIENFTFTGATSVAVGTTVTATNQDGVTHTWTSEDDVWNSGGISGGDSFEFTFEEPGEYAYFCSIHPTMQGTLTVEG